MSRPQMYGFATALALGTLLSSSAHAKRPWTPPRPVLTMPAPPKASPYRVELIAADGRKLQTFHHRGRFYVLGNRGTRYSIRVTNPTPRRVEAVISVDGLDVIDGKSADFVHKRGYVVPPHGTLNVDGFRVSTSQVAAFRFSSVRLSYAGRKGKARNVGVVGVAIFEEQRQPEIIVRPTPRPRPLPYDYRRDLKRAPSKAKRAPAKNEAPAPGAKRPTVTRGGAPVPPPRPGYRHPYHRRCCVPHPQERPGLGTEFGERRYSAATWTRFVRANPRVPSTIATLRYNDASGLQALGIRLPSTYVSADEISKRETANPFPGSSFAQPPR